MLRKVRKPRICTFPVQSWFSHFGQGLVHPLGFDFLACQVGEQHLSANPNGCGKSNNSQEMCFESEAPCSDVRDDIASRKPVYLCVLRWSISKGSPVSSPESQFLHWRVQNHSRGSSWGLASSTFNPSFLMPPAHATCSESLCNWANTKTNLLLQHAIYYTGSYFMDLFSL